MNKSASLLFAGLFLATTLSVLPKTSHAQDAAPIFNWRILTGQQPSLMVENQDGVQVKLTCTSTSVSPVRFDFKVSSAFTKQSSAMFLVFETNLPSDFERLLATKLPREQLRYREDPEDPNSPFKVDRLATTFAVFYQGTEETDSGSLDLYATELSRNFQGGTIFRILRDAVTDFVVTAELPDGTKGRTRLTASSSTAQSRSYRVQECGEL